MFETLGSGVLLIATIGSVAQPGLSYLIDDCWTMDYNSDADFNWVVLHFLDSRDSAYRNHNERLEILARELKRQRQRSNTIVLKESLGWRCLPWCWILMHNYVYIGWSCANVEILGGMQNYILKLVTSGVEKRVTILWLQLQNSTERHVSSRHHAVVGIAGPLVLVWCAINEEIKASHKSLLQVRLSKFCNYPVAECFPFHSPLLNSPCTNTIPVLGLGDIFEPYFICLIFEDRPLQAIPSQWPLIICQHCSLAF